MPVDSTHPLYDEFFERWARARDVVAGEDRIKDAGETYLPRLDSQDEEEYQAYKTRATFFNASGRTVDGFQGMVFRRDPIVKLPDPGSPAGDVMKRFETDVDMFGTSLYIYAKEIAADVLEVGRAGTLVEWHDAEKRPFVCLYQAEQIINWRVSRIGGKNVLSMVVLQESADKMGEGDEFEAVGIPQIRVLRLNNIAGKAPAYSVDIWHQMNPEGKDGKPEWRFIETRVPQRLGKPLPFIPFVFHGPLNDLPDPVKPPLDDVVVVNLAHYRMDADFKHGAHYTALPTAWVAGFDKDTELKIGSSTAWVSENPQARAGFLEFVGQGLGTLEREKDRLEKHMAVLGSRLLEVQKRVSESAEALGLRQAGESSIISNISASLSKSLTKVLRWAFWWVTNEVDPELIPVETIALELNRDFETARMTAPEVVALIQAWQAGMISHDTVLDQMRQGEIIAQNRTNEEERELIENQPPPLLGRAVDPGKVGAMSAAGGGGSMPKFDK
jgi:hypothetical protein